MKRTLTICGALLLFASLSLSAQYQRIVLIEDFSSVTCVNCPQASAIVNAIAKEKKGRVVTIQYHLDIPGRNDPFYAQNKPEQDARERYYGGFNALPQMFVDGIGVAGTNEAEVRGEANNQLGEESPIKLTVTQTIEGGAIKANIRLEGADKLPNGYRLYAVAVEKFVQRTREYFTDTAKSIQYYNETEFHDLFRKFATPSGGVTVGPAATQTFDYTIALGERWDPREMSVIAWVQDEFNAEIAGAGFSQALNSVERADGPEGYEITSLAPNPAGEEVSFSFTLGAAQKVTAALYSVNGEKVRSIEVGMREAGDHRVEVETGDLPSGTYHLRVEAGPLAATRTLQVVK